MIRLLLTLFLLPLIFAGCNTGSRLGNQNMASLYSGKENTLHPHYALFNIDASTTRLFFRISNSELLYTREGSGDEFSAQLLLLYKLYNEKNTLIDSGSVRLRDVQTAGPARELAGQTDIDAPGEHIFSLEVSLRDLNRKTAVAEQLELDKTTGAKTYFLVSSPQDQFPLFDDVLDSGQHFRIRHTDPNAAQLHVQCWFGENPASPAPYALHAAPPFVSKPDSSYTIDLRKDSVLRLPRKGMYFFRPDTMVKNGLTLFRFENGYPEISQTSQLLPPLRFLTMREEYREMSENRDTKAAVDAFWLEKAGSEERARVIIKKFYGRVEEANSHFTSYTEGWKTDRGMIFVIFGPPQHVYKSGETETWIYGDGTTPMSLQFQFSRVRSPYSGNLFVLNRSANYKAPWTHAVDQWRQGRVYSER
ncbi:MAG: hypothetical protein FD123_4301 [Bacteroidetes bacterium]|nr:MAG: hypothetical protein FD123_4301 [Bacteroidota bacterium]